MFEFKILSPRFKKLLNIHTGRCCCFGQDTLHSQAVYPFPCVLYHTGRVSACPAACCRWLQMLGRGWVHAVLECHAGTSDSQHTLSSRCVKSTVSSTWSMDCAECLLATYVGVLICPGCISLTNLVMLLPIMGCVRLTVRGVSRVLFSLGNLGQKCGSQVFRILNIRQRWINKYQIKC